MSRLCHWRDRPNLLWGAFMKYPVPSIECIFFFDCSVILGILKLPAKNTECAAEVTSKSIIRMTERWTIRLEQTHWWYSRFLNWYIPERHQCGSCYSCLAWCPPLMNCTWACLRDREMWDSTLEGYKCDTPVATTGIDLITHNVADLSLYYIND